MQTTFYELTNEEKQWVKKHYPHLKSTFSNKPLSAKNVPSLGTEVVSIHTSCPVAEAVLQKMPSVKLIVTRTTGVDHIDLAACRSRKITVVNCPGLNATAVAEFVFGLLLDFYRQIPDSLTIGKRLDFRSSDFVGMELAGKTIGIVGTGAIGAHVAQIAHGFGMQIVGFDFKKNQTLVKKYGLKYMNMKAIFERSDIISLHIPATPMTAKIINRTLMAQAKKRPVLINTARGSIVDSEALLKALKNKQLSGYLTDVFDHELEIISHNQKTSPQVKRIIAAEKAMAKMPNVFITPHMAYASKEASARILAHSLEIIDMFGKGKRIQSVI